MTSRPPTRAKGEGSIYQIRAGPKAGRWAATLDLGRDERGHRRRKTLTGATRQEARRKLGEQQALRARGREPPPDTLTVADALQTWLASVRGQRAPRTGQRLESLARLHVLPQLGAVRLQQFTPARVLTWQQHLEQDGLAPRSILKARSVLSSALTLALRLDWIARNVVTLIDAPRVEPSEARSLNREEITTFLRAIQGDPLEVLYLLSLTTTLRRGELLGLRWSDIDWATGVLTVRRQVQEGVGQGTAIREQPKTRAGQRVIVVPAFTLRRLVQHRQEQQDRAQQTGHAWTEEDWLFPSRAWTPLQPRNLHRQWSTLRTRLGLTDLKLHGLRHSATSFYLALGVPPHVVQRIAGHADPGLTLRVYAHVADADLRAAADVLDRALEGVSGADG